MKAVQELLEMCNMLEVRKSGYQTQTFHFYTADQFSLDRSTRFSYSQLCVSYVVVSV